MINQMDVSEPVTSADQTKPESVPHDNNVLDDICKTDACSFSLLE